jgi:hypothetical protein
MVKEESSRGVKDETLTPPTPSLIEREANSAGKTRIYIAFYFVIN